MSEKLKQWRDALAAYQGSALFDGWDGFGLIQVEGQLGDVSCKSVSIVVEALARASRDLAALAAKDGDVNALLTLARYLDDAVCTIHVHSEGCCIATRDAEILVEQIELRLAGRPAATPTKRGSEADALAILALHPDWSNTQIADEAGVNRTSLYEMKTFLAARAAVRQAAQERRDHEEPKAKTARGAQERPGSVEPIDDRRPEDQLEAGA